MEIRTKPSGKPVLYLNGYAYFRDNNKSDRIYWRCTRKGRVRCSARAVSLKESDGTPVFASESNKCTLHDHPPCQKPLSRMKIEGTVLDHDGFCYARSHRNAAKTRRFWRCQTADCPGLILSKLGERGKSLDANLIKDHNHASDQKPCFKCSGKRRRRREVIYASATHECHLDICRLAVHKACGKTLKRTSGLQRSFVFCSPEHRLQFQESTNDTPSAGPPTLTRVGGAQSDVESSVQIQSSDSEGNSDKGPGDDQQAGTSHTSGKKRRKTKRVTAPLVLSDEEEEENPNPNGEEKNHMNSEKDESHIDSDEEENHTDSREEESHTDSEEEESHTDSEEDENHVSDNVSDIDDDQDMQVDDVDRDCDTGGDRQAEPDIFRMRTVEYAAASVSSPSGANAESGQKPDQAFASTSSSNATNGQRHTGSISQSALQDLQRLSAGQSTGVASSECLHEDVLLAPPAQTRSVEPSTSSCVISAVPNAQDDAEGSASGPTMPATQPHLRTAGVKRPAAPAATRATDGRERGRRGSEPDWDLHREHLQAKIRKNNLLIEKTELEMALMADKRKQEEAREKTLHQLAVQKLQKETELLEERRKNEAEKAHRELALLEGRRQREEEREQRLHDLTVGKLQAEMASLEGDRKRGDAEEARQDQFQQLVREKTQAELELMTERIRREKEKAAEEKERHRRLQEMSQLEAKESKARQAWYEHCTRQ